MLYALQILTVVEKWYVVNAFYVQMRNFLLYLDLLPLTRALLLFYSSGVPIFSVGWSD